MKRHIKKLPVLIMAVLVIVFCIVLGSRYYSEEKKTVEYEKYSQGFTIVCPKLSVCGDAFLLYSEDEAIMIDTGETEDAELLLNLLEERGITSLKAMILTHFDKDHIGGASAILERIPVEKCYTTCGTEDSDEFHALMDSLKKTGTRQIIVTELESFEVLRSSFTIYPPLTTEFEKDQDNNLSLITSVITPDEKLLFAGDAEKERMIQYIENQYDGTQYTWLKVPHHGRDKKTVKMLLDKFIPHDAVICSSAEEPEKEKVVDLLKENGVEVWLTREGTAEFQFSTKELEELDPETDIEKEEEEIEGKNGEPAEDKAEETSTDVAKESAGEKAEASPEESGSDAVKVEAPVFSRESGFYNLAFPLTIKAKKGLKIYYTLDCSIPTEESLEYTSAINIKDVTPQPNNLSARTDLQPYRYQETSRYYTKIKDGWFSRNMLPANVDKCQVVRAVAIDENGNRSDVVTASYFVGLTYKKGYKNIAILSLVSDPKNLFDEDIGILVNGARYNTMWENGELDGKTSTHSLRNYCNTYTFRGRESERDVHLDYFSDKNKKLMFSQEAGIRLHGNQSRVTQSQKSFNLYARKSYDGNSTFLISFFKNGLLSDKVTLMRGNDVRNYILCEKMDNRTMKAQQYSMVQVFLDGEYWGIYAIQEKYNSENYLETRYNLEDGEYTLIKGTPKSIEVKKGDPDAIEKSFNKLKKYAKTHDLSIDENYQKLCSKMDIQSFIDGYAARLYVSDQDWNWHKNQYMLYYDNKWHWIVFDMDYGASWYNPAKPDTNSFTTTRIIKAHSLETDPFFPHLKKNADFRRQFVNTFLDLGNEVYKGETMRKEMDEFKETYKEASILEAERFLTAKYVENRGRNPYYISGMYQIAEKMALFFEQRLPYASKYAAEYFGLTGKGVPVIIENKTPKGGKIQINTIIPKLNAKNKWGGLYYTDYPVTLKAIPKRGYEFVGWEASKNGTLADASAPETELSFKGKVTVKAVFRSKKE